MPEIGDKRSWEWLPTDHQQEAIRDLGLTWESYEKLCHGHTWVAYISFFSQSGETFTTKPFFVRHVLSAMVFAYKCGRESVTGTS